MRRPSRVLGSLVTVAALATALGSVQPAVGQSPTPWPVPAAPSAAPGTVCALLTNEEVGRALGFEVTGYGGSALDCAWMGDLAAGVTTSMALSAQQGSILEAMKAGLPSGTDVIIDGHPAWFSPDSLWVDIDGNTLTVQLVVDSPEIADPQAVVSTLGAIAAGRFGGLPIAAATPAPMASGGQTVDFDLCALMPLGDVQAVSPFGTPLATAEPRGRGSGCFYSAAVDAERIATISLTVSRFDSAADAATAHASGEQTLMDAGYPTQQIAGLGDAAFGNTGTEDEAGVQALLGQRIVEAHLKGEYEDGRGPSVGGADKVAAGTELIRLMIDRLP